MCGVGGVLYGIGLNAPNTDSMYAFPPVCDGANKVTDYSVSKWMSMVVRWLGYDDGPKREERKGARVPAAAAA